MRCIGRPVHCHQWRCLDCAFSILDRLPGRCAKRHQLWQRHHTAWHTNGQSYGANWSLAASNSLAVDYCTQLPGVACDTNGNIRALFLFGNGLNGTLPASIGTLSNLVSLNLQNCQTAFLAGSGIGSPYAEPGCWPSGPGGLLRGTIPASWAALTNLNTLGISGNALTGSVPSWLFSNLTSLTALSLHANQLTGSLVLPANPNAAIAYLNVAGNHLSGPLPTFIGWNSLNYLYLAANQFSGSIPASWGSMAAAWVYLERNNLSGTLPAELANNRRLSTFIAGYNNLTGTLPAWLGSMTALNTLLLNECLLTGTLPPEMGLLTNLQALYLRGNSLRGTIPLSFNALTGLTSLQLSGNQLYGSFPASLAAIQWVASVGPGGSGLGGLSLDATFCSRTYTGALLDYNHDYMNTLLNYTLKASCPIRPCPANTWSATGNDTDGSAGGCMVCPAGLTTVDLGGVSPNATAAGHAGAVVCSGPPHGPYLTNGEIAGPVIAFFVMVALVVSCERGAWRRCNPRLRCVSSDKAYSPNSTEIVSDSGGSLEPKGIGKALLKVDASELQLGTVCGTGFMGTVYSAVWRGAPVAVKVFKDDLARTLGLQNLSSMPDGISILSDKSLSSNTSSFFSELEMLSSVRHPNILACFAFVVGPPAMLVVELGTAGSLKDLLARTSLVELPWRRRLELAAGVAAGVEFLHSLTPQLIHGDLKSANIVLDGLLVPKIADFGLSFLATGATTRIGKGTPAYCAPEVARALPITNEPAIDVYGLGCILHDVAHINTDNDAPRRLRAEGVASGDQALTDVATLETRQRLWEGNSKAIQILVSREAADYQPVFASRVPPSIRSIIQATLATQPDMRPSAAWVRTQLLALTRGQPLSTSG